MKFKYWYWNKYLSMENIKDINKKTKTHSIVGKDSPSDSKKTSIVKFIKYSSLKPYLNNCINTLYNCNKKQFGAKLYGFSEDPLFHYNVYSKGAQYNWHMDANGYNDEHDIKFTILINVSKEPYKGGKFKMWFDEKPRTITELDKPGDMVMFRSYYLHKVTPVTKGIRQTLTLFLIGPRLQ